MNVIIAVGYRVNSYKATQFRIWATKVLKEYLVKGNPYRSPKLYTFDEGAYKDAKKLGMRLEF